MSGTTTSYDIFTALVGALDRVGVNWSRAVSLATDGAPSMIGRKAGVPRESAICKWRTEFLDFSLYFAPGGFVLQVIKHG